MSRGAAKKVLRRTWRTRGIRLNADTPLNDVEITNVVLGSGSFGAEDVRVARWCGAKVAAKTLQRTTEEGRRGSSSAEESTLDLRSFSTHQRRVLQECHLMGQLRHPNIAQVYGVFIRPDGNPVIISELLGESMQQRLAFGTRLTYRDVVDVALDVLQAMRYLHTLAHPLLHGSICTSNVLFSLGGSVKLTDSNLALARLHSASHSHMETMPEQHVLTSTPTSALSLGSGMDGGGGGATADGVAPRSASARLYLPLDALDHDCYDLGIDTYSFGVLIMAMVLHREPNVDEVTRPSGGGGDRQRKLSNVNVERSRRATDLKALSAASPQFMDLVDRCMDAMTLDPADKTDAASAGAGSGGGAGNSEESQDVVDCGLERAVSRELFGLVEALRRRDDYVRWPSTRCSPFARGLQEQADLALAVRGLERQVQETVDAATATLADQEKQLERQVGELANMHQQERRRHTARIKQLEAKLSAFQREAASNGSGELSIHREGSESGDSGDVRSQSAISRSMSSPPPPPTQSIPRSASMQQQQHKFSFQASPNYNRRHSDDSVATRDTLSPRNDDGSQEETDYDGPGHICEVHIRVPSGGLTTVQIDNRDTIGEIVQGLCDEHGIADFEEYSLLLEDEDAFYEKAKKESEKSRKTFRGEKKLESIRRRWRGNDVSCLNWLQHDKTLQEQGIDTASQVLTLKKHTLTPGPEVRIGAVSEFDAEYKECKAAILDSSCPCPVEEACTLAALQCHVQFGAFAESNKTKMKAIQEEIKDFLPRDYQKNKQALRRVLSKYTENSVLMSQAIAQSRYIAMCKNLPAYGSTVFVVKAAVKNKSKLAPSILAITKENVLKLDEKNKEVQHLWPIKNVRRWVSTTEMVQIDIGETEPVSFMTHDGQAIANLISMYKGIRTRKSQSREANYDGGDPVYEEVSLKPMPSQPAPPPTQQQQRHHVSVTRSESTFLRHSPRLIPKRVSAEAPASVSLSTSTGQNSPLIDPRPRPPVKSPPPTYDILEPGEYSATPPSYEASEYLEASDVLIARNGEQQLVNTGGAVAANDVVNHSSEHVEAASVAVGNANGGDPSQTV
ncbi:uncharacterized protein LOC135815708 [Sycon ciliatum]|uniref:uncharacterized protein LOC135815708 n=1 Tax=Sycon ciliatum TaxID=27933 RepID=UPI0031F6A49F